MSKRLGMMKAGAMMLAGIAAALGDGAPPPQSEAPTYSLVRKAMMPRKDWKKRKRRLEMAKHSRKQNR